VGQERLDVEAKDASQSGADRPELRDADAMSNSGQDVAAVLQALEVSEATYHRWRNQYGGMKSEEAKRLKALEDENRRLKQIVPDKELDIQMLKHVASGNCRASLPAMERGTLRTGVRRRSRCRRLSACRSEGRVQS
jgi:putative transposase